MAFNASASEIVVNGGFENSFSSWTNYNFYNPGYPPTVPPNYISTTDPKSGSKCYYTNGNDLTKVCQDFTLSDSCNLTLGFYYKHAVMDDNSFWSVYNSTDHTRYDNTILYDGTTASTDGNWIYTSSTFNLPAGVYTLVFEGKGNTAYFDDVSLDDGKTVTGNISSSTGVFEYGSSNQHYNIIMENGIGNTYYVDVYGLNSTAYTYIANYSFVDETGYNVVSFTAPLASSGYTLLYAVLRDADNNTYANTTDCLVNDADNYFFFDPHVIGLNDSTTLYYNFNYSGYLSSPIDIVKDYLYQPGQTFGISSYYVSRSLENSSTGTMVFQGESAAFVYPCIIGYGLYWHENRLNVATYQVVDNVTLPETPEYTEVVSPSNQSGIDTDVPSIPDSYNAPSYPSPSSPDNDDNEDNESEPGDNNNYPGDEIENYNSSSYNESSGAWNYNNDTGSGDGFYPVDVPGNTSVDTSRFQGFYNSVDGVYSPLNNTVYGFLSFVLSPITSLRNYTVDTKDYFLNSTTSLLSGNVITECVVPVFNRLPPIITGLIVFGLSLSIISLLLGRS